MIRKTEEDLEWVQQSSMKRHTCKVNEFEVCIGVSIIKAKYANVELTYVSAVRADCQFCLSIFIL